MGAMRVLRIILVAFAAVAAVAVPARSGDETTRQPFTAGQLLVAAPTMGDPRFAGTVIYMVNHDAYGAMGLVVNRMLGSGPLDKFLEGFGIDPTGTDDDIRLYYGGPVDPGRGFVLHTSDYVGPGTTVVSDEVAMSVKFGVLRAIAAGEGPRHSLFILGYAGWGPGQLEREMDRDDWLTAPPDIDLIFADDLDDTWERASRKARVTL